MPCRRHGRVLQYLESILQDDQSIKNVVFICLAKPVHSSHFSYKNLGGEVEIDQNFENAQY